MSNLDLVEQLSLTPVFKSTERSALQLSEIMSVHLRDDTDETIYADTNEVVRINNIIL